MKRRKTENNKKEKSFSSDDFIIPVYINEKIVLDMLAIVEDGFSTVSQVNYTTEKSSSNDEKVGANVSTSATLLSKLLRLDFSGSYEHSGAKGESENIVREKIHTNVSLFSKFRSFLIENKAIKNGFDFDNIKIGDFVEVTGKLEKNPLVNYMEIFVDFLRFADSISEKPTLGNKKQANAQKVIDNKALAQIEAFSQELTNSGTIDFVLSDEQGTLVLSAQEQYLSNDNISEIIGGSFKVLGKVISICPDSSKEIDLLRKTSLSVVSEKLLDDMFSGFKTDEMKQFNLPEIKTKIFGPAIIVIPIAIFA